MATPPHRRAELATLALLFLLGAALSLVLSSHWPAILTDRSVEAENVWFQADSVRVRENITDRWSNHSRSRVHPLFSLLTNPAGTVLTKAGVAPWTAVRLLLALASGLLLPALFFALRTIGLRRLDALLALGALCASAAFVFWAGTPDTYLFGALTIVLVLCVSAVATRRPVAPAWFVAAGVAAMSVTITNFSAAIAAAFVHQRWPRALRTLADALLIVVVLWTVQKLLFPSTEFFLQPGDEKKFVMVEQAAAPLQRLAVLVVHSVVLPAVQWLDNPDAAGWPQLSIEHAPLAWQDAAHGTALASWVLLLGLGLWSAVRGGGPARFRAVLLLALGFQLALHLVYGEEAFLYSAHLAPLLAAFVGLALLRFPTWWARAAFAVFIVSAAVNNVGAYLDTTRQLLEAAPGRAQLLGEMAWRPHDPWPRGSGHTLLAGFDWPVEARGWLEPAGAFSPALGSFGVSFRVVETATGAIVATSESIDLRATRHAWINDGHGAVGVTAETPSYRASWFALPEGGYRLAVQDRLPLSQHLELVVRSVGPAGGPLKQIAVEDNALRLDDRWQLSPVAAAAVTLGDEQRDGLSARPANGSPSGPAASADAPARAYGIPGTANPSNGIPRASGSENSVTSPSGWRYARVRLDHGAHELQLTPLTPLPASAAKPWPASTGCAVDGLPGPLPGLLAASTRQLLLGLVRSQTRPGDPVNYPLQWQRDAAYVVVALARCGHGAIAQSLAQELVTNDFFGGFGSEADAPGLALWALSEVVAATRDMQFLRAVWPHVDRKVALIRELQSATRPVRHPFSGPLLPRLRGSGDATLVAWPAQHGVIQGRMDGDSRPFYTTAASIGGLKRAAWMAERLGRPDEAVAWRRDAAELTARYRDRMANGPRSMKPLVDDRTLINALYPTEAADRAQVKQLLERRAARGQDERTRAEGWTYFDLAIAHQWLRVGEPQRARDVLEYYRTHDRIPGLWVLWEGTDEENSFGGWNRVRGNPRPHGITPHYWASAEAQLLALAMLAYEDEEKGTLVLGAGLEPGWVAQPVSIGAIGTGSGFVCWRWDGRSTLTVGGDVGDRAITLGEAFPPGTVVKRGPCPGPADTRGAAAGS